MIDIKKVKVGDVFFHRNRSFLGKAIRWFLNFARKRIFRLEPMGLYNHTSLVIEAWDQKFVIEAIGRGVRAVPLGEMIENQGNVITHKTWKKALTTKEQHDVSKEGFLLLAKNIEYDKMNFIYHIWYIFSKNKRWPGPRREDAQKKFYCSELTAYLMDKIRGSFKGETWDVSPLEVDLNKSLKLVK